MERRRESEKRTEQRERERVFWNSSKINGAMFEEGKLGQKAELRHLLDKSSL
jgi:hypothetical protein